MEKESKSWFEFYVTLFLIAFFGVFFVLSFTYPKRPGELPMFVSGIAIILLITQLIKLWRAKKVKAPEVEWGRAAVLFGMAAAFVVLAIFIGFLPSAFLLLFGMGLYLGAKSKVKLAIISLILVVSLWLIFDKVAMVGLPTGLLFPQ